MKGLYVRISFWLSPLNDGVRSALLALNTPSSRSAGLDDQHLRRHRTILRKNCFFEGKLLLVSFFAKWY